MNPVLLLAGLGAVVVPVLFALAMVSAWALIRNSRVRGVVLAGMLLLALAVPARIGIAYRTAVQSEARFRSLCEQYTEAAFTDSASAVSAIRANLDPYSRERNPATAIGDVAFPHYLAARLLLTGAKPYESLVWLSRDGHTLSDISADGRQVQEHRQPGPPAARYGFEWRDNGFAMEDTIGSADLVVMDYLQGSELAVQPVFILFTPRLTAVAGFAATPFIVAAGGMNSCPSPLVLAEFIQSVLQPAPGTAP